MRFFTPGIGVFFCPTWAGLRFRGGEFHLHFFNARQLYQFRAHAVFEFALVRIVGAADQHRQGHQAVVNHQVAHHVQRDDVLPSLWLDHLAKGLHHLLITYVAH